MQLRSSVIFTDLIREEKRLWKAWDSPTKPQSFAEKSLNDTLLSTLRTKVAHCLVFITSLHLYIFHFYPAGHPGRNKRDFLLTRLAQVSRNLPAALWVWLQYVLHDYTTPEVISDIYHKDEQPCTVMHAVLWMCQPSNQKKKSTHLRKVIPVQVTTVCMWITNAMACTILVIWTVA
jgi:hypothetical protein